MFHTCYIQSQPLKLLMVYFSTTHFITNHISPLGPVLTVSLRCPRPAQRPGARCPNQTGWRGLVRRCQSKHRPSPDPLENPSLKHFNEVTAVIQKARPNRRVVALRVPGTLGEPWRKVCVLGESKKIREEPGLDLCSRSFFIWCLWVARLPGDVENVEVTDLEPFSCLWFSSIYSLMVNEPLNIQHCLIFSPHVWVAVFTHGQYSVILVRDSNFTIYVDM